MNIYKLLYWIIGILILALIVAGIYMLVQLNKGVPTDTTTTTDQNNTSGGVNIPPVTVKTPNTNTASVTGQNGEVIAIKDFLHNGETVPDTVNPGFSYLAGSIGYCLGNGKCPSGYKTDEFTVSYNAATESFNVALLKMPLDTSRNDAEKFLMDRLGLHRIILCNLSYYVDVPSTLSSALAGKNLGFSICPGATILKGL
jgi:hypothetical protein